MQVSDFTQNNNSLLVLSKAAHAWIWEVLDWALPDTLQMERLPDNNSLTFGLPKGSTIEVWESKETTIHLVPTSDVPNELGRLILSRPAGSMTLVGITFGDLFEQIELRVHYPDGGEPFGILHWQFQANMPVGSRHMEVQLAPRGNKQLLLDATFDKGPALGDLVKLLGGDGLQDLEWLPDELKAGDIVEVTQLHSIFERESEKAISNIELIYVAADLTLLDGKSWRLIPDFDLLKVGELEARLSVDHPLESAYRHSTIEVTGKLIIEVEGEAPARIGLTARWPDYAITGELLEGDKIPVGALLQQLGLPAEKLPEGDDTLVISKLGFAAEPTEENQTFSFHGTIENVWQLEFGNETLSIDELSLYLNYHAKQTPKLTGSFYGQFTIAEHAFYASVERSGDAWVFSGGTNAEQTDTAKPLEVGTWISGLAQIFDPKLQVPSSINDFTINKIEISFSTRGDFSLDLECHAPIGDGMKAVISYDSQERRFEGQLFVDDLEFTLIFSTKKAISQQVTTPEAKKTLLAIYRDPSGHEQNIHDLVELVSSTLAKNIPTSLTFTLKDALFVYQKKAQDTKYLFGVDIEGGLNLSDLKLPDLPLVGQIFPPDQTLKLAFQLLVPSKEFTADPDIAALNSLGGDSLTLPNRDIKGVDFSPTLYLGKEVKQLSLPIAFDDSGTQGLKEDQTAANTYDAADAVSNTADAVSNDGIKWVKVQKSFGPVHFERLGLKYNEGKITGLLDASLGLGGLTISLEGLSITSPLTKFNPVFNLQGLGLDYDGGAVEIGGAFLKQQITPVQGDPYTAYSGLATVRTETLALSAIGSYAKFQGHPSMFIYMVLDYPLGGPSFFFVTGLAGGFGYNRALKMPTIEQVKEFPLIEEALKGAAPALPSDQEGLQSTLSEKLTKLNQYIPPAIGENFLAVGIKFTSFKLIDSFALLVVKFGGQFELDLLGLSTLVTPPAEAGKSVPPVAKAELAIKASFIPDEGFLGVQGQLTSESFILSHDCHLTGGFAFYSWLSGPHAGDFVATMGGYHPRFHVPEHYPKVPRLGLNWQVNDALSIKGQEYYALTAHALMAGGSLEALYQKDELKAWFKAGADFLISWKPYHYDASLYVSLQTEATIHFAGTHHVSFDAGADLHIWGPEFAGEAHIHVKVIGIKVSFDVEFGSGASLVKPISWDEFKTSFLPPDNQICGLSIKSGLVRKIKEGENTRWIVNPKDLIIVSQSAIPITNDDNSANAQTDLGVSPMGVWSFDSRFIVTTSQGDFALKPILKAVPSALWGKPDTPEVPEVLGTKYIEKPKVNGEQMIQNSLAGFELSPANKLTAGATHTIDKDKLRYEEQNVTDAFGWQDFTLTDPQGSEAFNQAKTTIIGNTKRNELLNTLGFQHAEIDFGQPVDEEVLLTSL